MKYIFPYKNVGKLSDSLLLKLIDFVLAQSYVARYNWVVEDTNILGLDVAEVNEVMMELEPMVQPRLFKNAIINKMPAMTYIPEHSDLYISKTIITDHKIHIPIITSSGVGFMWPGLIGQKGPCVLNMELGNVYLFNNIDKHCVVNLSNQDRYHFVLELGNIECVE